jgi:hypothetical protein
MASFAWRRSRFDFLQLCHRLFLWSPIAILTRGQLAKKLAALGQDSQFLSAWLQVDPALIDKTLPAKILGQVTIIGPQVL